MPRARTGYTVSTIDAFCYFGCLPDTDGAAEETHDTKAEALAGALDYLREVFREERALCTDSERAGLPALWREKRDDLKDTGECALDLPYRDDGEEVSEAGLRFVSVRISADTTAQTTEEVC